MAPDNRQATLQTFVRGCLKPGIRLCTDEAAACRNLSAYHHAGINHGRDSYGRGSVHTNGIGSFRALFKWKPRNLPLDEAQAPAPLRPGVRGSTLRPGFPAS